MIGYPSISTEYVRDQVGCSVPLDTQTVELAFLSTPDVEPGPADWVVTVWLDADSGLTPENKHYRTAGVLRGPSELVLAEGDWHVWHRVTDTPEVIVQYLGAIKVT